MQREETKKKKKEGCGEANGGNQHYSIGFSGAMLIYTIWKWPVLERNEINLHQRSVSHRRNLPPVAATLQDRWLWGRGGNQWNKWI